MLCLLALRSSQGKGDEDLATLKNSTGLTFLRLNAGEFTMGSSSGDEKQAPPHVVEVSEFWLSRYEVTQKQWRKTMGTRPWAGQEFTSDGDSLAASYVSWSDATAFCKKLTESPEEIAAGRRYRLPTEAEWEYACRAGSKTLYSFGDDPALLWEYAWWYDPAHMPEIKAHSHARAVGTKKPNAWSLYDMHGNVCEWCGDWAGPYSAERTRDPKGLANGRARVRRGNGWLGDWQSSISAARDWGVPEDRTAWVGFRPVLVLDRKQR